MSFGERLQTLRKESRVTQVQLAAAAQVSAASVRSWEQNEKKPSMDAIVSIARFFDVSTDFLLGFSPSKAEPEIRLTKEECAFLSQYRSLDTHGRKAVRTICSIEGERIQALSFEPIKPQRRLPRTKNGRRERYIPRYTTPSAAGYAVPLDGADFEMLLVNDDIPEQADYAVAIQGDSMEPYIQDGETVFVQKDATIRIGDVGIFCVDGAMYCKQYYVDAQGTLILVSANPLRRDANVVVPAESGNAVRCCGKVILDRQPKLPEYILGSD